MTWMQSRPADNPVEALGGWTRHCRRAWMSGVDMQLAQRMLDVVAQIPPGRVSTYGDVAARAGSTSPRLAGFVLAHLSDETTPWHRVLRADGRPAPHLASEQLARLRAEGVPAEGGRVSLARFRYPGPTTARGVPALETPSSPPAPSLSTSP